MNLGIWVYTGFFIVYAAQIYIYFFNKKADILPKTIYLFIFQYPYAE